MLARLSLLDISLLDLSLGGQFRGRSGGEPDVSMVTINPILLALVLVGVLGLVAAPVLAHW